MITFETRPGASTCETGTCDTGLVGKASPKSGSWQRRFQGLFGLGWHAPAPLARILVHKKLLGAPFIGSLAYATAYHTRAGSTSMAKK